MTELPLSIETDEDGEEILRIRLDAWRPLGAAIASGDWDEGLVAIDLDDEDGGYGPEPTDKQRRHLEWLVENQRALLDIVLETALRLYKGERLNEGLDPDEESTDYPIRRTPEEMVDNLEPWRINLNSLQGVDIPYVGMSLLASWDVEQGIGIMTKGLDLVSVMGDQHLEASSARFIETHGPQSDLPDEYGYQH